MQFFWILGLFAFTLTTALEATPAFPHLSLYDLQGEESSLPSGKKEIVFVGRTNGARHALRRWYQAFCDHSEQFREVSVTVVPVFPSFMSNRLLRCPLITLIRQHIPEHMSHHVGVLFSSPEEIEALFQMTKCDFEQLCVFLVYEQGSILWKAGVGPTQQTIRQLKQLIQAD